MTWGKGGGGKGDQGDINMCGGGVCVCDDG